MESLLEGAVDTLDRLGEVGSDDITVIRVPGAYELPVAAQKIAQSNKFDAIIALGAVIRGGTPHFEFVAGACTDGLLRVTLDHQLPLGFCVLTTDDVQQAIDRSGDNDDNKGRETALATLEMVSLFRGKRR